MSLDYFTVMGEPESITVIEKSKFICNLKNIDSEEDAREFIEKIRKNHPFASHGCYAFIADDKGLMQKFSDAGEPQGTAGLPMLDVLKNRKFYKTVAVVTRYFGGKKLGTGGLVRAYGGAVDNALNNANVVHMCEAIFLSVKMDYDDYGLFQRLLAVKGATVLNTDFADGVKVDFVLLLDNFDRFKGEFTNYFNGKLQLTELKKAFYPFK